MHSQKKIQPPGAALAAFSAATRGVAFPGVCFTRSHHCAAWLKGATPATRHLRTPALIDAETGAFTAMRAMPWHRQAAIARAFRRRTRG